MPLESPPLGAYSGQYMYSSLPPPQPYPYGYPFYPPYGYPIAHPPPNPAYYEHHEEEAPPPPSKLHAFLDNDHCEDYIWDVRLPASKQFQYRSESSNSLVLITEEILQEPATSSKVKTMKIICNRYKWDIDVKRASGEDRILLKQVLDGIYESLHEPLTESEWDELSAGAKRNAHISRGVRLTHDETSFKVDGRMRRVDVLGERTIFSGLQMDDTSDDWVMHLAARPRR